MSMIHESIQVNVPIRTAYNQWTQFEDFPRFIQSLQGVRQLDDTHVHWKAEIWGKDMEWDAEITRQIPDKLIEWKTVSGEPDNGGFVEFRPLDSDKTEVNLHIAFEPSGVAAKIGNALGIAAHRVHSELEHYKSFLEQRGSATGAWRGEVPARTDVGQKSDATWGPAADSCDE